jgi:hypothetical protein
MTLKKAIVIFVFVYGLIGLYFFAPKLFKEEAQEAKSAGSSEIELEWDVANELNGNFRTPAWLKNAEFKKYVEEEEYNRAETLGEPEFTSTYQLMSLLAQLQLGDPTIASSFVNPYLSHSDYESKKVAEITKTAESLATKITKNRTLTNVKISPPTKIKDDSEVSLNVILQLNNGEKVQIKDVPMIKLKEDHGHGDAEEDEAEHGMWYMNINLQELAQRVEKTE